MSISLRPYQEACIQALVDTWEKGERDLLAVLPTGAGKTVIFNELIYRAITGDPRRRCMVLAHRDELIRQPIERMRAQHPDITAGVIKAGENQLGYPLTVASVQTLSRQRRLDTLPPVDLLITDEAHHSAAPTYGKIYAHLRILNPDMLHAGFTATAKRTDGKPLASVFQRIAYSKSIRSMILEGFLVQVRGKVLKTDTDLDGIAVRAGDYAAGALSERVNNDARNGLVLAGWQRFARDRKTLVFCADVKHAQTMAEMFRSAGVSAEPVWGDMPTDDRKRTLRNLQSGRTQVVTNCMVLTEGFDDPSIACIIMARPTTSPTVITQAVGRGLRLSPETNKTDCLALFVHDKSARIGISQIPTLLGNESESRGASGKLATEAPTREVEVDGLQVTEIDFFSPDEIRGIPVDLINGSRYAWSRHTSRSGTTYWSIGVGEATAVIIEPNGQPDCYNVYAVGTGKDSTVASLTQSVDLETAMMAGESYAADHETPVLAHRRREWRGQDASRQQRDLLWRLAGRQLGGEIEFMSRGEASEKISFLLAMRVLRTPRPEQKVA